MSVHSERASGTVVQVDPHHDARRRGEKIVVPVLPCPDGGHALRPLFVEVGNPNVWTLECSRTHDRFEYTEVDS